MILITGGTGLVGAYLTGALLRKKQSVRLLIRPTSQKAYLNGILDHYRIPEEDRKSLIEWAGGDILDIPSLEDAMNGIETIYHSAAMISFHRKDRERMFRINIGGTANIVNVSLSSGVKKICHVSSIAALGRPEDHTTIIDETMKWRPSRLNTGYALSKHQAEWEIKRGIAEGLEAIMVNPSIILGRAQTEKGSARLFETALNGLKVYPPGTNGFVDVEDVVDIMIDLMERNISGERFILNAINITYKELFAKMAGQFGQKPPKIRAGGFLREVAWRAEAARSLVTGRKPLITKETARTAGNRFVYSNDKIIDELGFKFKDFDKTIYELSRYYSTVFKKI